MRRSACESDADHALEPRWEMPRISLYRFSGYRSVAIRRDSSPPRFLPRSVWTLAAVCGIALAVLCAQLSFAGEPGGADGLGKEDGARLLARCEPALRMLDAHSSDALDREQYADAMSCIGFVDGFIWGHGWASWREKADMWYCPPEYFSHAQAVPVLVAYLRDHPERLHDRAHLLTFLAFTNAYPCLR